MRNAIFIGITVLMSFSSIGQDLMINEVMPSNAITTFDSFDDSPDWLEIYNTTNTAIQLSDYYISDDQSDKLKWKLPTKNLQPNKWVLIYCSGRDVILTDEYHANFKLGNNKDTVGIYFKDGSTIHELIYDSLPADVSFGAQPDGTTTNFYFNASTPKATNNNAVAYSCFLSKPQIFRESGFYSSPLALGVSHPEPGVQLHYTENGDEPTPLDPTISGNFALSTSYVPNRLSEIPTNPGLNAPQGFYTVTRSNNRGYVPPAVDVQNINVFTVKAFKNGCIAGESETRTFLLDDGNNVYPSKPILSLQTDSFGFFSQDTGIYVYGTKYLGNYLRRGAEWERGSHLVYFDESGNKRIDQKLVSELHGNGSRHSTHKNIRVTAKSRYGSDRIEADLFEETQVNSFKHLILRSPGHRPDCMPRDELATDLVKNLGIDVPFYSTSVMYLNGEYWGINVLKERLDDDYLSIKYDIDKDDVVILEGVGELAAGELSDTIHYHNMTDFVHNNSLDDPQNMAYLETQMDIENYLDYMISEIYVGNGDWPTNNVRYWRKRTDYDDFASPGHDGRWRWLFFDIDGGFGGTCEDVYFAMNNLERALTDTGFFEPYTRFFRDLTSNQSFREMYINRSCDRLNTNFMYDVIRPKLDEIVDGLNPVMMDHVNRFGYPSTSTTLSDRLNETPSLDKWNYLVSRFELFMVKRNFYIRRQMKDEWNLADTFQITIDVNDASMGYVQLNTIEITEAHEGIDANPYPWGGKYFEGIDIPMIAHPYPGYRFKEWQGLNITKADTSVNISGDTLYTAVFEVDPNYVAPLPITINEVQAWNTSTVFDENFEYDDWIELYNPNSQQIDITGYYLTDDRDDLTKYWIGANRTVLPGKDWMVFWADDQTGQGQNHTNFKLNREGDFVALVAPDGVTIVDSISFGSQKENFSFGRQADGMNPWIEFVAPTPFYSNLSTSIQESQKTAKLEVFPNPVTSGYIHVNKTISGEIYNLSGVQVKSFAGVNQINVSDLRFGVYILRDATTGETIRFIVN